MGVQSFENSSRSCFLQSLAKTLLEERALRAAYLPQTMFGEFAWDSLLLMFQLSAKESLSAADISDELGSSPTSTSRWLDYLEEQGLCETLSELAGFDLRTMMLTDEGRHAVTKYLEAVEASRKARAPTFDAV